MALIAPDFDDFFRRVIRGVAPYLGDMVIAGGCANALYRHHPVAQPTPIPQPGTKDLDLACRLGPLPAGDRPPLMTLLCEAGLDVKLFGTTHPAVMKFSVAGVENGPEVELLCPLIGAPWQRGGDEPQAVALQDGGVTAQPLQYLDLLLFEPWRIDVARVPGFADMAGLPPVLLPHPLTYVIQKVLARDEWGRTPAKLEKDCYYIYEVSVVFRDVIDGLVAVLPGVRGAFPPPWIDRFRRELDLLFGAPAAEGPVSAARVARAAAVGSRGVPTITEAMVHASVGRLLSVVQSMSPPRR